MPTLPVIEVLAGRACFFWLATNFRAPMKQAE